MSYSTQLRVETTEIRFFCFSQTRGRTADYSIVVRQLWHKQTRQKLWDITKDTAGKCKLGKDQTVRFEWRLLKLDVGLLAVL